MILDQGDSWIRRGFRVVEMRQVQLEKKVYDIEQSQQQLEQRFSAIEHTVSKFQQSVQQVKDTVERMDQQQRTQMAKYLLLVTICCLILLVYIT